MTYIVSIGLGIPSQSISQEHVKTLIPKIFPLSQTELEKLLPVFDHAEIHERQLVVPEDWFMKNHTFEDRNDVYQNKALSYSLDAIDQCLSNENFLIKD